ncbi:MAG: hypothetical protein SAJ12_08995 [Jaaginema sp. PMC 1079.18]|nr:hypothetical protein [Jaaginema sp. PMC 1080.18]MEC4851137.1 hypothetical protein [Jaaginema sp. PMC 1079.18]MEC4866376.1 hypothetical protein [Jaaginema sp. PMC 1078.18]
MGSADISFGGLVSRAIRSEIGERLIDVRNTADDGPTSGGPIQKWIDDNAPFLSGLAKTVFSGGNQLKNFATNIKNKLTSISLSEGWGFFQQAKEFVMNFNFNATDAELDQLVKSSLQTLVSEIGEMAGCAVGYATCGGLLGAGIIYIDPGAAIPIMKEAVPELKDEFAGLLGDLARTAARAATRWLAVNAFKHGRRLIKRVAQNPGIKKRLPAKLNKAIESWGAEGSKPWTIAQARDNLIENIPNEYLRTFAEEFVEGFDECCTEAGYVIAQSFDGYKAQQLDMRESVLGVERYVEVTPNRDCPDERFILAGRDAVLRPALVNAMTTYSLINNRDVGQIVAAPVTAAVEKTAKSEPKTVTLILQYAPINRPPFTKRNAPSTVYWRMPTYQIPYADPDKIDYAKIRRGMGGSDGIIWGKWEASGWIDGRKLSVRGHTEQQAIKNLEQLAEFSSRPLEAIGVRYTTRRGERGKVLTRNDDAQRVYPAYASVLINSLVMDKDEGRVSIARNFSPRKERFEMWADKPLPGYKELMQILKQEAKKAEARKE